MIISKLIGPYSREDVFEEKLNKYLDRYTTEKIEIQYQMVYSGVKVLHSALLIIKDDND